MNKDYNVLSSVVRIIHKTGLQKDKLVASAELEENPDEWKHEEYKGLT